MYPVRKGMPFYASLLVLRVFGYYPSSNNNKQFLGFAYYLLSAIWCTTLVNFGIGFVVSVSNGNDASEDLAYLVGFSSCMFVSVRFATYYREWSDLFESLATYHNFEKPPKYNHVKRNGDKFTTVCVCYVLLTILVSAIITLATEDQCEKKYNGQRICGLLYPVLWPSQITISLLAKRLFLALQAISALSFSQFLIIVLVIYQTVDLICARVDHMSDIFSEICLTMNIDTQNQRLRLWIEYHEETHRLCGKLKKLSKHIIGHIFLCVSVTVACFAHQLLKEINPIFLCCIIPFYGITFIICHVGQILEDKMTSIGDFIYLNQWNMLNPRAQKVLPFIIARSQYKVGIDVLPIGKANYLSFVMFLKTSYSYFTLLNNVAED